MCTRPPVAELAIKVYHTRNLQINSRAQLVTSAHTTMPMRTKQAAKYFLRHRGSFALSSNLTEKAIFEVWFLRKADSLRKGEPFTHSGRI